VDRNESIARPRLSEVSLLLNRNKSAKDIVFAPTVRVVPGRERSRAVSILAAGCPKGKLASSTGSLETMREIERMKRRDFISLTGFAAAAVPFAARAREKAMPIVGILLSIVPSPNFSPAPNPANADPFHQGLRETGFVDGQNVAFEYRFAEGHNDRLPALAADLVRSEVDLIFTGGSGSAALAAKHATATIPIVFGFLGDPVGMGLVASLARPGGNVTGFSAFATGVGPKLLDLLCDLIPRAGTIGLLANPNNPVTELVIRNLQEATRVKGVTLAVREAGTEAEINDAFASFVQTRADALMVAADSFFNESAPRAKIVALASRHAVPAAYQNLPFAAAGGLMVYAADQAEITRQAGIYAGRILKGARPAELPIQQPTTFKLVVNLKTAKALGLTVPQSILVRADEVIE
jgi:putative tryptophan/tyrosine transport system substrate-binding protein